MKLIVLVLSTVLVFIACSAQKQESNSSILNGDKSTKIEALINDYQNLDIFSGVVLIAENGRPIFHKAYGLANRDKNIENTIHTKFTLGSMNKSYTHVLVLQLIEEGKLNFETKLIDVLEGINQSDADKITIEMLLNHTSGFGDYFGTDYMDLKYNEKNIAGILKIIKTLPLNFKPGTENMYSNAGYIILGAIIEKITSKSYAQNVQERILEPLSLKETYVKDVASIPNKSIGYTKGINGVINNLGFISEPKSDGGFWGTAEDVMIFYRNYFYGDKLIDRQSREKDDFFSSIKPYYNMDARAIPLAGGMNGLNTVIYQMLKEDVSIVVLANMDEPVAEKIGFGIFKIINGKTAEKAVLPASLNVYKAYNKNGIKYVEDNFEKLIVNFHPTDPKDLILNKLGYDFLFADKNESAIEIFTLNCKLFPDVANCYDSLGEAYLKNKDFENATKAYQKALALNPNMETAKKALNKIKKKIVEQR